MEIQVSTTLLVSDYSKIKRKNRKQKIKVYHNCWRFPVFDKLVPLTSPKLHSWDCKKNIIQHKYSKYPSQNSSKDFENLEEKRFVAYRSKFSKKQMSWVAQLIRVFVGWIESKVRLKLLTTWPAVRGSWSGWRRIVLKQININ